ncbi:MAG TPA: L-ribulose-5-phosphate 4-epimerase [Sedimentisphaerales bacterium]|jgi:L-ribulose-5-phosphate 4-epimerase|nr:L-ribulose-5-phosphate 4-epimerase [Sedimentisphaerales bacterium]HNU28741.1 L-ribulose-5-phosphate 4-epimerase [Sedimentisphaerales bacterium]
MYEKLKQRVYETNLDLQRHGLVVLTWGNVSAIDRAAGIVAIKPSGVRYEDMRPEDIVLVDLDGRVVEGKLKPSSDTPTHVELYKSFEKVGGICHTHSMYATMWAQARCAIPCFGTTHADGFYGPVPVTDPMTDEEVAGPYEENTGKVIIRRFAGADPMQIPAVLVANHGPFTWGATPEKAVENAVVLEQVAKMAFGTILVNPQQQPISQALLDRHYLRKHGKGAYYGQG